MKPMIHRKSRTNPLLRKEDSAMNIEWQLEEPAMPQFVKVVKYSAKHTQSLLMIILT